MRDIAARHAAALGLLACATLAGCARPPVVRAPAPAAASGAGQVTAVLINGGGNKQLNFQSHLTHVQTLVELLRTGGVDDVTIFASDGDDRTADLATRASADPQGDMWLLPPAVMRQLRPIEYVDSRVDGFALKPASSAALRAWFADQGKRLRAGDTLLLYVTDHGDLNRQDPNDNTIVLWNETLSVNQLRELLAQLDPGVRVVMLMSQCFSGSFANAIFTSASEPASATGQTCGFFASSADRPAYGCYPENLGREGVGHSFHFFHAWESLGRMSEAHRRVLLTDDSPDVPNTTSDFYLAKLLAAEAAREQRPVNQVTDDFLRDAFEQRAAWEPEIRQLDRVGSTFGMFSPRSFAELEQQTRTLPAVSAQLRTYAQRWNEAVDALKQQNFMRFLGAHPSWRTQLNPQALASLDGAARQRLAIELSSALARFTAADADTTARLAQLRDRAKTAADAAYRMDVRLGVVLRMRALLEQIAGREYLAERGTAEQRETYQALLACEDTALDLPQLGSANGRGPSAASLPSPAPFPALSTDREVVDSVMPAWMGIAFQPLPDSVRQRDRRPPGAVTITTVYPDSAAAKAGLEVGDVILGPPGAPFREPQQVREWTMQREIGEPAPLRVARAGRTRDLVLRPEPFPIELPKLPGPPALGSVAPEPMLASFRGDRAFAAGRKRLLFFWATWCLPCKYSVPEVMAFAKARDVEVVAITDEDPDTLKAFFAERTEPFPATVAIDPQRITYQAFGVSGTPTFVLLDSANRVQFYGTGYSLAKGLGIEGWQYSRAKPVGRSGP